MPVSVTPFCVEMQYKSSCMLHQLLTYDGYFPISNMGCIWVTSEKQSCCRKKQMNDENYGPRIPNEGINQRNLKIWAALQIYSR